MKRLQPAPRNFVDHHCRRLACVLLLMGLTASNWWLGCSSRSGEPSMAEAPPVVAAYPPQTRRTRVRIPAVPRPEYLVPITDPTFHTRVTRITDAAMDELGMQADRAQKILRHGYSKRQPWNNDGTLINLRWYLLDGRTYQVVGTYTRPSAECFWSYNDPRKMWTFDHREHNLETITIVEDQTTGRLTGVRNVVRSFPGYDEMKMGFGEGNLSWDDRYVALAARKGSDLHVLVYDIIDDRIVSETVFEGKWPPGDDGRANLCRMDWCSMSASGEYVVILWLDRGPDRYQGVEVYDRDLTFQRQLTVSGTHGDLGYDTSGQEVWVQLCHGNENPALATKSLYDASIAAFRLHDGSTTRVMDLSLGVFSGHVSCRNYRRPGWAYVTAGKPTYEAFAVRIDGSQTVERFAHTHAPRTSYQAEMHGVPSPDGTKFMFASNWNGDAEASIYCYVAEQPADD